MSNELLSRVRAGVVRVGEGFGMVIKVRTNLLIRDAGGNPVGIDPDRDGPLCHEVVTAACCLPPYHEHDDDDPQWDCRYSFLIGPLDQPHPTIEGENMYVEPDTGVTLLGAASLDEYDPFDVLGSTAFPLPLGACDRPTDAWLLAPNLTRMIAGHAVLKEGAILWVAKDCPVLGNVAGMPLVDAEGRAIGIISTSHADAPDLNILLAARLPDWLPGWAWQG